MPAGGVIIGGSSTTATGVSLATLYRRLAQELGYYQAVPVTTQATVGEASRIVLADELRDDEGGYDFLGRTWAYASTGAQAGTQRRVLTQPDAGYQGSMGALAVSRPFGAALGAGDVVEMTSPLPIKGHLGVLGLREIVNQALALITIEARLALVGNGTYTYDLAAYPWLLGKPQTRGIDDAVYSGLAYPTQASPYAYEIRVNGAQRTLVTQTRYSTADTFELLAIVRADRYVYDGAAWAFRDNDDTPGLQGDAWQTAAPPQWVHAFAMVKALQFLTRWITQRRDLSQAEKDQLLQRDILPRRQQWALAAARIKTREFPTPVPPRKAALVVANQTAGWT